MYVLQVDLSPVNPNHNLSPTPTKKITMAKLTNYTSYTQYGLLIPPFYHNSTHYTPQVDNYSIESWVVGGCGIIIITSAMPNSCCYSFLFPVPREPQAALRRRVVGAPVKMTNWKSIVAFLALFHFVVVIVIVAIIIIIKLFHGLLQCIYYYLPIHSLSGCWFPTRVTSHPQQQVQNVSTYFR